MMNIEFFLYLTTAVLTLIFLFKRMLVEFLRMTVVPLVLAAVWLINIGSYSATVSNMIALAVVVSTLFVIALGIGNTVRKLFSETDRRAIIRHITLNEPYSDQSEENNRLKAGEVIG